MRCYDDASWRPAIHPAETFRPTTYKNTRHSVTSAGHSRLNTLGGPGPVGAPSRDAEGLEGNEEWQGGVSLSSLSRARASEPRPITVSVHFQLERTHLMATRPLLHRPTGTSQIRPSKLYTSPKQISGYAPGRQWARTAWK